MVVIDGFNYYEYANNYIANCKVLVPSQVGLKIMIYGLLEEQLCNQCICVCNQISSLKRLGKGHL
jgi:hypothetical protein